MNQKARGFTIVELLIVIVVIGILAAISIVAYSGVSNNANDSTVQQDLRNSYSKILEFYVLNGRYPGSDAELGLTLQISRPSYLPDNGRYIYCKDDTGVALMADSKSRKTFYYSKSGNGTTSGFTGSATTDCAALGMASSAPGYWARWIRSGNIWNIGN